MATVHYSYKGKGRIHIRKKVPGALWREIGNCSKLEFSVEEETEEMLDYRDGGGGVLESDTQIKSVKGAASCYDMSPENVALGVRGVVTTRPAEAIPGEAVTATLGSIIPLARLQDLSQAMVVTNDDASVTYGAGVDYIRLRAGIAIPLDEDGTPSGAIANAAALKVTYQALADSVIQAMAASADDYELMFDGLNDARSGKPVRVLAYKNIFSPTKGLGLITDKFGSLDLEFTVKKDESITGAGLSRFFRIEIASI